MVKGLRKIDELGRITIPSELRRSLGWECKGESNSGLGTPIKISVEGKRVILESAEEPTCSFCGGNVDVIRYEQGHICIGCFVNIKNKFMLGK